MTLQEQSVRGISTLGLQNLSTIYRPAYSYQTNEPIFHVFETPSKHVLIKEIDPMNDDAHVAADDPYQQLVENNNRGSNAAPILSEWELHLIQLSEQLAHSCITLSSDEYISMSMTLVPEVLASLNAYTLKEVNLTWSFSTPHSFPVRCKIVRILREDIESLAEFSIAPLDKAKNQYIAINGEADLVQSPCLGHPEVVPYYYDFDGYYKYTVCSIDLAVNLIDCQTVERCQTIECFQTVDRTKIAGLNKDRRPTMTISEDRKYIDNKTYSEPQIKRRRPANKSGYGAESKYGARKSSHDVKKATRGPEKSTHDSPIYGPEMSTQAVKYGVAIAESHRGHSELQLPKEWNAFNTLFRNTQLSSIQFLCLKSREVSVGARQQQSSSNQQNQRSDSDPACRRQIPSVHTRRAAPGSMRSAPHTHTATHTGTDTRAYQSHTRGDEAFVDDNYEIKIVDLTFSAKVITQLLHASHYDEIIQQLENIPSDLSPEALIPPHFIVGVAYFKTTKYRKAREHFERCAALAEEVHRDGDVMLCNAYLGDMEYASQSYLEAAEYYKKAVKHYASGSVALMFKLTPPTISAVHAKLASAFRNVSMMVQATHHYQTAIGKATIDRDRLSAHTSLGNLYQSMGDNTNALKEYEVCIELAEVLSDHVSLGWAHGNIGNAYLGLNRKDEAIHHLKKSKDLAVEYERTPQAIGRTYNNLGTAYQSMNNLDKAEEYYDLALAQAVYGDDKAGQARVYGNIGNVHMLRKNYERAIPHYGEVLQLSKDAATISTAQHNRGCAYYDWATFLQKCHENDGAFKVKIHSPECDIDTCLSSLSSKSKELYRKGTYDLEEVVKYHEERLQHIKGSRNGLTLSVSLFESNSRTFHRLQDCLVNLHMFDRALVVAEQSRARTLGELLLKRNGKSSMNPPLKFDQVTDIVKNLVSPVIYFSYTGARLICWVFVPDSGKPTMHAFDRPLNDEQFDGKSFDYHLRYSLTEKLVEHSFEMYQQIKYDSESSAEVQKLFNLIGEPIQSVLLGHSIESSGFLQLTSVSDSYTALLPLTCLQDPKSISFFGDRYYFNSVPSLLTLGIMNQTSSVTINLKNASNDFCIVGDPNIPPFRYNDDLWYLGRLPYAKREAEWVAHALRTTPVLSEHATKSAFLSRLQRAKIVHVATHGSASAGFLAFAAFAVRATDSFNKGNTVGASNVLLFPEEVEKLHISPALVVLSSCDSGRGTVKADGIQGMARAFILAGAQSVLTTLWKVPDESASVFMQFFYQYLIKGVQSSFALQKAILSVRCFTKYSQYIHWSGYQLTGRDICLLNTPTPISVVVQNRLDKQSIFPRLSVIEKLERLIKDPILPTDVQILKACSSINPSEVAKDFILSSHAHFSGGIFWISCHQPATVLSSVEYIQKVLGTDLINMTIDEEHQVLFVFDRMSELPNDELLLRILRNRHVHIIVVYSSASIINEQSLGKLIKEIDQKIVRGCTIHTIEPLTMIHSTQRMVFKIMEKYDFTPTNADQKAFEQLAELTLGSPLIINTMIQLLLNSMGNEGAECLIKKLAAEESELNFKCDLFDSLKRIISCCKLSCEEELLLNSLAVYAGSPVPMSLVKEMSQMITQASHQPHLTGSLHQKLTSHKLLLQYPLPMIMHPILQESVPKGPDIELVYVPQHIAHFLKEGMNSSDKAFALTIAYYSMCHLLSTSANFIHGACSLLNEKFEQNYDVIGKDCYQQMLCLYFSTVIC